MSRFCLCFPAFLLVVPSAVANIYTVGPAGAAGGCTHSSIQNALNAAAAHVGADEIRIVNTVTYSNQALVVNDNGALTIEGGFADCNPLAPVGRTTISGLGGAAASVLRTAETATVDVTLMGLDIRDGEGDASGYGGGILHAAKGKVTIVDSRIHHNSATYGGGIAMHLIAGQTAATRELVIGAGAVIGDTDAALGNSASSGGGIYLDVGSLTLGGADAGVIKNSATSSGGGIALVGNSDNVRVDIGSGGNAAYGVISGNQASSYGGAISAVGSTAKVRLFTTDAQKPVDLIGNTAQYGGAFNIAYGANLSAWQAQVTGNIAQFGGVLRLVDGARVSLYNNLALGSPPATAVACASGLRCNLIADNTATAGPGAGVAEIVVTTSGVNSNLSLESATLLRNGGYTLFRDYCSFSPGTCGHTVAISGCEISANSSTTIASFSARPQMTLEECTVAGNGGADTLFLGANVILSRSIVWQPGRTVFDAAGLGSTLAAAHVITHDATGFPTNYTIRSLDPRFVNAATGDFRLRADSPALDSAPSGGSVYASLDGTAREVDLAPVPNYFGGTVDLGGYELATYPDTVFANGFEADL